MKSTISFKMSEFTAAAKKLGGFADQVPFALAGALNDSAEGARKVIVEDLWPSSIQSRNKSFIKAALTTKDNRANKRNLRVAIVESDKIGGRGNLMLHADGGTRSAKRHSLAIPAKDVAARRTGKGVPKRFRELLDPSNKTAFKKGDVIYARTGKYKKVGKHKKGAGKRKDDGRHLKLMFVLKPRVPIRKDVPFRESFRQTMRRDIHKNFATRLDKAMKTRLK